MWVFRLWKCIDMSAGKVEDEMLEWATHKAFVWPTFFFIQSATLLECIRKLRDFKFESEPACIIKPGHEQHLIQFKWKPKVCHWKEFWQRFFFFLAWSSQSVLETSPSQDPAWPREYVKLGTQLVPPASSTNLCIWLSIAHIKSKTFETIEWTSPPLWTAFCENLSPRSLM